LFQRAVDLAWRHFSSALTGLPYVARQQDVPAGHAVCGLGVSDDPAATTRLIPPEELAGDGESLVLVVADGTPRDPLARKRHPLFGQHRA
jgi:hypothetical protein